MSSCSNQELEDLLGHIHQLENQTKETADKTDKPKSVLVIGPAGSGKTTLISYLAGVALESNEECHVEALEGCMEGFEVGHGIYSQTKAQTVWHDGFLNYMRDNIPRSGDSEAEISQTLEELSVRQSYLRFARKVYTEGLIYEDHTDFTIMSSFCDESIAELDQLIDSENAKIEKDAAAEQNADNVRNR